MIAEARLRSGIAVALNTSPHSVAFNFQPQKAFLDIRCGLTATWDKVCMTMDGVNYAYNQWHVLEKGTPFYEYIFDLIDKDYVNPLEQMSGFFNMQGV